MAKNEHSQYLENTKTTQKFKLTLYNLEIVNWKNYNEINFIAKAKKLETPFYSNYIYSQNVEIYKNLKKNIIYVFLPYSEIYTNLYYGKTKNLKAIVYTKEKNKLSKLFIYSKEILIRYKKILLLKNFIYKNDKVMFYIYYPTMEIYLH